jgi:hypothetical protein
LRISAPLRLRATVLALAAGILASCAEPPPPAPPPAPPPVTLSPKLIEQAAAYRRYVDQATTLAPAFADGAAVAQSLRTGASYEPQQLIRGAIAYAAIVALQDPQFVASVRAHASDVGQRQTLAYEIMKDPAYAVGFAGSAGAASRISKALGDDGRKLFDQGKAIRLAAYEVQRAPWSKAEVVGRDARLANIKTLSATPGAGDVEEILRLSQATTGVAIPAEPGDAVPMPYTPTVVRGLAVAALAVLGHAGEQHLQYVMPIVSEVNASNCLNLAKLNLYQCLAVSKPHYEDVFCLGVHAMMDTGRCIVRTVGQPEPQDVRTQPLIIAGPGTARADPLKEAVKPTVKP